VDGRSLRRIAALVVGMPLLALAVVTLGAAVPDRLVLDRLHDAMAEGQVSATQYLRGASGGVIDRHSECKRMSIGLGGVTSNPFENAVRSPTLGSCAVAVPKITAWAEGGGLTSAYEYFRYWHGGAAVMRPAVAVLGVTVTRVLAAVGVAVAACALWRVTARRVGALGASALLAPIVLATDLVDLHQMLVHAIGMIVALGAAALLVARLPADAPVTSFALAGFASGGAFLFFADLTNPDAAWSLSVVGAAIVCAPLARRAAAVRVAAATGGWLAGFAWLWFTKWVVAAAVVGFTTVRRSVGGQIGERLDADVDGMSNDRTAGLARAWREWWDLPATGPVVAALVVTAAVVVVVRRREVAATWAPRLLIAAPALIPVVWHLVMRNHTLVHGWFTYRSFAVAFGAVLLACTARFDRAGADGDVPSPHPGVDARADQAYSGSTASGSMS
jgi:hypothetical protein